MKPQRILCPVDFSDTSRNAVKAAAELAVQFDASLTLLHVFQVPALTLPDGVIFSADFAASVFDGINRHLEKERRAAAEMGAKQIDTASVEGVPWRAIVDRARDHRCDLIVIGTHGRTGLKHALLGSVAERVVRSAPCPVLTMRPLEQAG